MMFDPISIPFPSNWRQNDSPALYIKRQFEWATHSGPYAAAKKLYRLRWRAHYNGGWPLSRPKNVDERLPLAELYRRDAHGKKVLDIGPSPSLRSLAKMLDLPVSTPAEADRAWNTIMWLGVISRHKRQQAERYKKRAFLANLRDRIRSR